MSAATRDTTDYRPAAGDGRSGSPLGLYQLLDPEVLADPYPLYARLRSEDPVHWDPFLHAWVVTRYADVVHVLNAFSANRTPTPEQLEAMGLSALGPIAEVMVKQMLFLDAPSHTRIRKLAAQAFTPRRVEALRAHIQDIADRLIDAIEPSGRIDVIADIAEPLPCIVTAEMLGVPAEHHSMLKLWSQDFAEMLGNFQHNPERAPRIAKSVGAMRAYFRDAMIEQRKHPRAGLLGDLMAAEVEGDRLSDDEIIANVIVTMVGGQETTTNLIGNGTLALLRNPEESEKLRRDPSLVQSAVEELLRFEAPSQQTARLAPEDLELGGKTIHRRQAVIAVMGAANRDPARFPDPDRLDITRNDNRHVAFGWGPHFCFGAALARIEGQVTFETMLRRLPGLALAGGPLRWRTNLGLRGLVALPLRFRELGTRQDGTPASSMHDGHSDPNGTPRADLSAEKRRLLDLYLGGPRPAAPPETAAIACAPPGDPVPLSFEQELIWTHAQLAPELPLYNEILTVRRTGPLDVTALERAMTEIVRRHGAWRTTFDTVDGRAVQIVEPHRPMALPVVDLSRLAPAEREGEAARLAEEEVRRPLDLIRGPVLRAKLVRLAPTEHRLYLVVHQIVHDGVSVYSTLLPELAALYAAFAAGRPSPLPDPPIQYHDFASAQRRARLEGTLEPSLAYWRRQLADAPATVELPTDHARPPAKTFRGGQHAFALPQKLTGELKALSQREGVTLYVTLLAAFVTLLHRYSGQEDVVVGSATSTRKHPDVDRLLGVFLNTIVLRTRLSETMSFRSLLAHEKEVTLEGLSHADVPLHLLVKDLHPKRDPGYNPLFQVTFVLEPPMPEPTPGWEITQMDVDTGVSRVDLYLQMDDRPEGLVGHIRYSTDLWEPATIRRFAEHYVTLIEGVVTDPERSLSSIPMLTERERRTERADHDVARPARSVEVFEPGEIEQSIVDRFRKQVAKYGDRIAVKTARAAWTYHELDRARRKVACALVDADPGPGSRVALLLDHDASMLAGVLGALSSGRAYVPLDPTHPVERLRQIVEDSGAVALVSSARNLERARELARDGVEIIDLDAVLRGPEAPEPAAAATADTIAYLLYTSGSTGKPKGVVQNHRNVLHFIAAYTNNLGLGPDDRLTLLPSYGVDAAVMDIFAALLNGAALCPIAVREEGLRGSVDLVRDLGVTVYHSTPTLFRHVLRELSDRPPSRFVRLVVLGGEEVRRSDVEAFRERFAPECVLVNGYGPTESTVSLQYFVDRETRLAGRSVPIGRPVQRTEVSLLSRAGIPGQVHGEIAVVSPHVALGYWQAPEVTRRAFVQGQAGGAERVYKTGDIGRLLADGNIEYRGRMDQQTKILGFRVELGEIEAALAMHPRTKEVAAVVREVGEGDKQIVAYFAADHEPAPSQDELRQFLRGRLPIYMIPSCILRVDRLPWTTSGKLDRLALPAPERAPVRDRAPAADDLEQRLASIWARILRVAVVEVDDDFFELGGDSLVAVELMARIESELGVNLALSTLLEAPTVRRLADVVRSDVDSCPASPAEPHARRVEDRVTRWLNGMRAVLGRGQARISRRVRPPR